MANKTLEPAHNIVKAENTLLVYESYKEVITHLRPFTQSKDAGFASLENRIIEQADAAP